MSTAFTPERNWRRWFWSFLALAAIACALWFTPLFQEFDRRIYDSYLQLRPTTAPANDIVLVLIDDASLEKYGRWPWSRELLARMLTAISSEKPAGIGIDVLLPEAQTAEADAQLADAIRRAGNVVLVDKISTAEDKLWVEPLPQFAVAAARVGHAQAVLDPDGICRRFPLGELSLQGPRLAFALELANLVRPGQANNFVRAQEHRAGKPLLAQSGQSESLNPILALIPFRARTNGTPFHIVSASEVLDGKQGAFSGKTVLVGFGSAELHDRLTTPMSGALPSPGIEIHAHILDGILNGRTIVEAPFGFQFALLILTCGITVLVISRCTPATGIVFAVCLAGLIFGAGYVLLARAGQFLQTATLIVATLLAVPVNQLQRLVMVDRAISKQLHAMRTALRGSVSIEPKAGTDWKLQTLQALQSQLAALYEFEHALLESTEDRIAVFGRDGALQFSNSRFMELWWAEHSEITATYQTVKNWIASTGAHLDWSMLPSECETLLGDSLWKIHLAPVSDRDGQSVMVVMTDLKARMERDRARTEALGFVTHELRTPLVAIQGFAELMTRLPQSAGAREAPEIIFQESRRLVSLINSYLDVLRLDSGARPLQTDVVAAETLMNRVSKVLQPLADGKAIKLIVDQSASIYLECDEALVSGALLNLVSNAIKYGERGGEVQFRVRSENEDAIFAVWNSGQPIRRDDIPNLFEPYFRGAGEASGRSGWGLGLAFVKRIAERHNGSVSVVSDIESGTEFRMVLPGAIRAMAKRVET